MQNDGGKRVWEQEFYACASFLVGWWIEIEIGIGRRENWRDIERCKKWVFEEGIRASGALFGFPAKLGAITTPTLCLLSLSFTLTWDFWASWALKWARYPSN